ncbi:MAG: M13 family metallopeptidase [Spirochaetales bacterium]|nr:M13 family metallopeptidase [Spirochaetales bacterium]
MKRKLFAFAVTVLFVMVLLVSCGTTSKTQKWIYEENLEGTPWPNSNLYGNWPAQQPDKKDDFELAVNFDLYSKAKGMDPLSISFYNNSDSYQEEQIRNMIDDTSKTSDELELLRGYISLFLDFDKRNAEGKAPLMYYIDAVRKAETVDEISEILGREHFIFGGPFAVFNVGNAADDFLKYGVKVTSFTPVYSRMMASGASSEEITALLKGYLLYTDYSDAFADEIIASIIEYENYCLEICEQYKQENPDNELLMTLDDIRQFCPPLYDLIIGQGFYPYEDIPACYDVIGVSDFIALRNIWNDSNLELIKALLTLEMTDYALDYLDIDTYFEANGIEEEEIDVFEIAYSFLRKKLAVAVDQVFLEFVFPEGTRDKIIDLTKLYIEAMRKKILSVDWLSEQTKQKALEKIDKMVYVVVYPDEWLDFSDLLELVKDHDQNLLDAVLCRDDFFRDYSTYYIGKDIERGNWVLTDIKTTEPNAYYICDENSINILAGVLYEDLYDETSIESMLGTIGSTIGHEITHGFDPEGSSYNAYGQKENWWTDNDRASFDQRASRVAEAMDRIYILNDYQQDSAYILNEMVADLGGLSLSLEIASGIDGFNYDTFFTAATRIWFSITEDKESILQLYSDDNHPADYVRANFTLQQMDEFYRTYGITEGDGMYVAPKDRVAVW